MDEVPEENWYCDFCVNNRANLNPQLPIANILKEKNQLKTRKEEINVDSNPENSQEKDEPKK